MDFWIRTRPPAAECGHRTRRRQHRFMRQGALCICAGLAAIALTAENAEGQSGGVILPRTFTTMQDLLPQVHSVVEGVVGDIRFDYEECEGPRTVVRLSEVSSLLGERHESRIELRIFGGQLPNGNFVSVSEIASFVLGARHVTILRNTDWRFSPVIGNLAFRHETIAGKPVLVNSSGFAATGVTETGIEANSPQLTAAVGQRVIGAITSREEVRRELAQRPTDRGTLAPCKRAGPEEERCRQNQNEEALKRQRDQIVRSQRFARPPVLEGVAEEAVAKAISLNELVGGLKQFADRYRVSIGGYYSNAPRIGCWNETPTRKP
jgi:hypothetical protein